MRVLEGKAAVVTGATRGCGRGVAIELGDAGATVYCTGRSVRGNTSGRPETIEETAEMVNANGGKGIAVRVDHTQPAGVTEANWRDAIQTDAHFAYSETPRYLGRAIVALATDPNIEERAGNREQALSTWALTRIYGFRDVDGRQPHWDESGAKAE